MLRHATYRQERPWLALMGDVRREFLRPTRLMLMTLALIGAAQAGAPVGKAVPSPVKGAYTDARAWQTKNASKLGCLTTRSRAMKSGSERRMTEAERLCAQLEQTYGK